MREYKSPNDVHSGGGESLLRRLDAVSNLVDEERYWQARDALYGERWTEDLDLPDVPPAVLSKAKGFVDAAWYELTAQEVNPNLVRNYIFQARRALTG